MSTQSEDHLPAFLGELRTWLWPVGAADGLEEEHHQAAAEFLSSKEQQCLLASLDLNGRLVLGGELQESSRGRVLYVVKAAGAPAGSPFLHGYLDSADVAGSLLHLMSELYGPALVTASECWPDTLHHDFLAQMQQFVGALTETVSAQQRGRTVLYVPNENIADHNCSAAARQRELVQRLEPCLLRWTEQIGELLNRCTNNELLLDEGPLAELAFWTSRAADLGGIRAQLDDKELQRMLRVLELAKSPYLPAFLSLGESIQQEAAKAESNVRFLSVLEAPCTKLACADLSGVPQLLPGILDLLRLIWTLSPHHADVDSISSLLRKVGNEVINCCRRHTDLVALFSGQGLEAAERTLQQSIDVMARWKEAYSAAAARLSKQALDRQWSAIPASCFAHVDAYVQRCRDLQEMCAATRQFACDPRLTAVIGGPKATEIARALEEVHASFDRLLSRFRTLPYDALQVKNSAWYEDMAAFRSVTRDLELMLGNVVGRAFDVAPTLCQKLEVLETFYRTATREGLRKCIEVKMTEWHSQFMAELNQVKELFESVKVRLPTAAPLPQHAGQALLMKGLLSRIQRTWDSLQSVAMFLPGVPKAAESSSAYEAMHAGLQQAINSINTHWYRSIGPDLAGKLNDSLLHQAPGGLQSVNMDELAAMLEEAYLFERLRLGIPGVATELLAQRQRLLVGRGCMEQLVRQYNHILQALGKDERRLFKDRIRYLDRRVLPGVNKLNWSMPKHQVDFFQREASKFCKETEGAVVELKAATITVAQECAQIRGTMLVNVERKRLYELADFDARQAQHQEVARTKLVEAHARVQAALVSLYRHVVKDSEAVQQEWLRFLQKVDGQLLDAFTAAVRRSLHEVVRALNGEKKGAEVPPVFVHQVILETNNRVELKPTLQNLFDTVSGVCKRAVGLLEGIPRMLPHVIQACSTTYGTLPSLLAEAPAPPSYLELVSKSEDAVLKQMQAVTTGITGIVEKVQQLLTYYEKKFRQTYEQDKDMYMKRYERANKPVAAFEADISKFRDLSEEVLMEETSATMRFLRLDCGPLKQVLAAHCEAWISKFVELLHSIAARQLASVYETIGQGVELGNKEVRSKLQAERAELAGRVAQCKEKYAALEKLQVSILDEELDKLRALPEALSAFERALSAKPGAAV